MQDIFDCCCGLDVHKETIVACMLKGPIGQEPNKEIRTFGALLPDLRELRQWIQKEDCHYVAMESTGIYWYPVYEILETAYDDNITLIVANARHIKNVPGKKTDMKDAEWIASLLRAGLLNSSFIPERSIRELRDLTRYRKSIVEDMTSQKNRIEKFIQSCGFRLSSFISDIFGASGIAILYHLAEHGSITLKELDSYVKAKARGNMDNIMLSINGEMSIHQTNFLKMLLSHYEQIKTHIEGIEHKIEIELKKYEPPFQKLISIPGISITAASAIIAEIGTDMSCFKTAEHICSWAGLSPGKNESAGKKKREKVTKGNTYLKRILCEVAWVVTRQRNSYLSLWYWKVKQRRGSKRAIVALARKLLVIIYTMLKYDTYYDETRFEQVRDKHSNRRLVNIKKELSKLGFEVIPKTA